MKKHHIILLIASIGVMSFAFLNGCGNVSGGGSSGGGSGTSNPWKYIGTQAISTEVASYPSLFVYNGTPYVAFLTPATGFL